MMRRPWKIGIGAALALGLATGSAAWAANDPDDEVVTETEVVVVEETLTPAPRESVEVTTLPAEVGDDTEVIGVVTLPGKVAEVPAKTLPAPVPVVVTG